MMRSNNILCRDKVEAVYLTHEDVGRDHVELDEPQQGEHDLGQGV